MAPLANARHERFVQGIFAGLSGQDAYLDAFPKCKSKDAAKVGASRLLDDERIKARLAELKESAVSAAVMGRMEVLAELSKIGRSDIRNCLVRGDDTTEVIASLHDMAPEHSAAIQELVIETYMEGRGELTREVKRVRVKLHSKTAALAELRAHYEPQKHELAGPDGAPLAPALAVFVDKPPPETYEQWQERRKRELATSKA